jgi:hypothetical protein
VNEGEARLAGATHRAGTGRPQQHGASSQPFAALSDRGSGAPSTGRRARRRSAALLCALAGALALALAIGAGTASANLIWQPQYSFGNDGTSATSFSYASGVALQQAEQKLYVYDPNVQKIYKFNRLGPGEYTPAGGTWPVTVDTQYGDPDLDVDDTSGASKGNVVFSQDGEGIFGFSAAGAELPEFIPHSGEKCGISVAGDGHVWTGNYGNGGAIEEFAASGGEPIRELDAQVGNPCAVEVDTSNNYLFAAMYGGSVYRYTPPEYNDPTVVPGTSGNSKLAIDASTHRLYAYANEVVRVYDTTTLSEVETINVGVAFLKGLGVDEASGTLFITGGTSQYSGGSKITEWRKVNVPLVTTGDPVANSKLGGSVALDGGGEVKECWLEYGTSSDPSTFTKGPACEPAAPYTTDQPTVTSDLTGTLTGETTYYYRFVANNDSGTGFGAVKSFVPHNVSFLKTDPATEITRTTARLNGSYEGTNEETEYWFEWRQGASGAFTKTSAQTEAATTGPTSLHFDISGLTAGKPYTYRVVAKNTQGESIGQVVEFETSPAVKNVITTPATGVSTTEATLNGSLDPDGYATTYYFEWGKDTTYGQFEPMPPGLDVVDTSPGDQDVSVQLGELESGTTYHYRLVGVNSFEKTIGNDQTFSTPQPPSITSFNATNVAAESADLVATINPNGFATEYWFEYGLTENYGTTVPIPAGELTEELESVHPIDVPITGLEERTYHFRLTAKSEWGTVVTEDQTFNFNVPEGCPNQILRQETGSAYVPDCRAYELVSARNANGTALFPGGPTSPYAEGIFGYTGFLNLIPGSGEPQTAAFGVEPYVATRTQDGWITRYVGVPGSKGIAQTSAPGNEYGGGNPFEYHCWFYEEEQFSCGVETPSALPHDKRLEHILVWNRFQKGLLGGLRDGTNAPEVYDNHGNYVETLPTNTSEVEGADKTMDEGGWIGSARISPDYTHYAFSSIKAVFAPGGLSDPPGSVYDDNLQTGEVNLVSKQENGEDIHSDPKSPLTEEYLRVPGISDDGTHILISSGAPAEQTGYRFTRNIHLYMAVNEGNGEYAHYDITRDKNGKDVGVLYEEDDMTADGKKVFFITEKQMTEDDTDTSRDLFEWNEDRARNGEPPLVKVSTGNNGSGDTDDCDPVKELKKTGYWGAQEVPWTNGVESIEGSHLDNCSVKLPFIWPGQGGAYGEESNLFDTRVASETGEIYFYSPERLDGARGFPNKRNLYVWRDGKAQFVATFEPSHNGSWTPKAVERINVSPDGRHMAFITKTRLTGYDNAGKSEMYLYDAAARTIKCVSCRPDGKPPISDVEGSRNGLFMSFDGRTFWSTRDSLTPRDANNNIDVYEFTDGRPQLITTGTSDDAGNQFQRPGLVGVSGNGIDVYFMTFQTLVTQDENGQQIKFYDARVNGGFAPEPLSPPCQAADECHGEVPPVAARPEIGTSAVLGSGGNWSFGKKHARRHKRKHRRHKAACKKRKGKGKSCRSKKAARKRSRHG